MRILQLPIEIRELALANQQAQGNPRNVNVDLGDDRSLGNFNWDQSPEGQDYWMSIDDEYGMAFVLDQDEEMEDDDQIMQ